MAVEAFELKLGTATTPQPGFFPFLSGVFLMALGGILLLQALRGLSTGTKPFKFWGAPAIVVGALCVYVAIFNTVGYVIATIPLGMVILLCPGYEKVANSDRCQPGCLAGNLRSL